MAAAADLAGVARTLKQQAGVRSLVPLKDALALLAQVNSTSSFAKPNVSLTFRRHTRTAEAPHGVAAAALGLHHNATTGTFYFPSIIVIL